MAIATLDTPGSQAVIERPMYVDPAAQIPIANILPAARDFPDDDWLNIPNVPVFSEHTTVTRGGRELTFGRKELEAVCANCNRRIRDSGDFAGITIGHTPDPEAAAGASPMPLIGLVGPFRLGLIRQPGGQAKWAILGDFHVQRDRAEVIRQYPRRSAELWVEDAYEDMYLDPVALLGAETPRLDMGLLYSAVHHRNGRRIEVEKYSACAPSATSVFVPSDDDRKHPKQYSAESAESPGSKSDSSQPKPVTEMNTMTPEDIQQITSALEQLDWVQWVKSQMQGAAPADAAMPPAAAAPAEMPPVEAGPPAPAEAPPVPPPAPVTEPDGDENLPLKYSRLAGELTTLRGTVEKLNRQLEDERGRRVNTERYAALADCRRTRLFELDSEFELLKYGRATDEQFASHLERINTNYREIPLGQEIPTFDLPASMTPTRPGGKKAAEKYSREVSEKALRIAKQKAMAGESVSYEEVLESVANGQA